MALTSPGDTPRAIEAVLVTGEHWIIITLGGRLDGQSLVVHNFFHPLLAMVMFREKL